MWAFLAGPTSAHTNRVNEQRVINDVVASGARVTAGGWWVASCLTTWAPTRHHVKGRSARHTTGIKRSHAARESCHSS